MPAAISAEPYLLAVARALARDIAPKLNDARDQTVLRSCRRVLVEIACRMRDDAPPGLAVPLNAALTADGARARLEAALALRHGAADDPALAAGEGELLDLQAAYVERHLNEAGPGRDIHGGPTARDREALLQILRANDGASLELAAVQSVLAGFNKQILIATLSGMKTLPAEVVVRLDTPTPNVASSVMEEFPLQLRLHELGIKVPRPFFLVDATSPFGRPLMAMERVAGALDGHLLTPPKSRRAAEQLAAQLGRLHSIPLASLGDVLPPPSPTPPIADEITALRAQWQRDFGEPSLTADIAFDWLERHAGEIAGELCLVHGDIGFHNIMVEKGELSAILDWEIAHVGLAAEDIGYCASIIREVMPHEEFMALYVAAGGQPMSERMVNFYTLLSTIRLILLMLHPRTLFETGEVDGVRNAEPVIYHLSLIMHRFSKELRLALRQEPGQLPAMTAENDEGRG